MGVFFPLERSAETREEAAGTLARAIAVTTRLHSTALSRREMPPSRPSARPRSGPIGASVPDLRFCRAMRHAPESAARPMTMRLSSAALTTRVRREARVCFGRLHKMEADREVSMDAGGRVVGWKGRQGEDGRCRRARLLLLRLQKKKHCDNCNESSCPERCLHCQPARPASGQRSRLALRPRRAAAAMRLR